MTNWEKAEKLYNMGLAEKFEGAQPARRRIYRADDLLCLRGVPEPAGKRIIRKVARKAHAGRKHGALDVIDHLPLPSRGR